MTIVPLVYISIRKHAHAIYSNISQCKNVHFQMKSIIIFLTFAQIIDCGCSVLTSTHNLCFRAKIEKNEYPSKPQFYNIKVGCKAVFITRTCFHDVLTEW